MRVVVVTLFALSLALGASRTANAYPWPVKPFDKPHAIRGAFDDPRFHLGSEGALSAFHFGVDIAVRDGTPVYAVAPGYVRRRSNADVTVHRPSGRAFGYWHIRPVVRGGQHVRLHQLLGYVLPGWGHVHLAEAVLRPLLDVDGDVHRLLVGGELDERAADLHLDVAVVPVVRLDEKEVALEDVFAVGPRAGSYPSARRGCGDGNLCRTLWTLHGLTRQVFRSFDLGAARTNFRKKHGVVLLNRMLHQARNRFSPVQLFLEVF